MSVDAFMRGSSIKIIMSGEMLVRCYKKVAFLHSIGLLGPNFEYHNVTEIMSFLDNENSVY